MSENNSNGNGCGCLIFIITLFVVLAFCIGIRTPWGYLNLDMFSPGIYLEDNEQPDPAE